MKFTLEDQILEVKRELAVRKKCYPDWIRRGTLRRLDANRQYQALEAALKTLESALQKRDGEQTQIDLT